MESDWMRATIERAFPEDAYSLLLPEPELFNGFGVKGKVS